MTKTEASGKTLDIAIENALKELNLPREQVQVTVLQEGGLLRQFKISAEKILSEGERVQAFLDELLEKMGFDNFVVQMNENADTVNIDIIGTAKVNVIGYRGEVLDALQYLTTLIVGRGNDSYKRVVIDSEGYRVRREKTLSQLAKNLEQKVKRTGRPAKLEPMNPYERRVIHTALQNSRFVTTESQGQGSTRHVVINPILESDILNAPTGGGNRKSLNFVYRSEKKRKR
jgi:spoIIIJ-associated protein